MILHVLMWFAAILLAVVGGWIAVMNAAVLIVNSVDRNRHASWIPLIGGVFLSLSLIIIPIDGARAWWWIPLLLDFGCAPGFALTAYWYAVQRKKWGGT